MGAYKTQEKIDDCMQFNILRRVERVNEKTDENADKKAEKGAKPVRKTTLLESNFDP